jgi:hypothetical protein
MEMHSRQQYVKAMKAIAKLLIEKGADVNAQGGYYGNALQAASDNGMRQLQSC